MMVVIFPLVPAQILALLCRFLGSLLRCGDCVYLLHLCGYAQDMWDSTPRGRFTSIVKIGTKANEHICSGVQIDDLHILTSASCIDIVGPRPVVIIGVDAVTDWGCQRGMMVRLLVIQTARLVCGMILNLMGV